MANQLPQLNAFGVYTVLPPFTITTANYRCGSLQLISALVGEGINIFDLYYSVNGLSNNVYQTDLVNGVAIVTLESNDTPTVILPSSYVDTSPVELAVPYSRLVLSLELGVLPDELALNRLLTDLQTIANEYVGVSSIPKLHKIPVKVNISKPEHDIKEAQRKMLIENHISFYSGKVDADAKLLVAKTQIHLLEQALIAANALIPH